MSSLKRPDPALAEMPGHWASITKPFRRHIPILQQLIEILHPADPLCCSADPEQTQVS